VSVAKSVMWVKGMSDSSSMRGAARGRLDR